jgi:FkbM family methyltransferase
MPGWEESTLRFVMETTDEQTTFIDIGAWIGPVSLVASARAKRVIAIEPDPATASELEEIVALNNAPVEVWRAGIDGPGRSLRLFKRAGFVASSLDDPSAEAMDVSVVSFDDIGAAIANPTATLL